MSTPAALPLVGVAPATPLRARAAPRLRAGQRKTRRTSLVLQLEDELLLDALRDRMGPGTSIGETLRLGLHRLAAEEGIAVDDLMKEPAAA
jgi:hypothetical protein